MTTRLRMLAATLPLLAIPFPALAWLGGDAASVAADRKHVNGTLTTTAAARYTKHEINTPSGTLLTEYLSPAGTVFAVVWSGPSLPDLRQFLGDFFPRYVRAANSQPTGTGSRLIDEPGLVVYAGGHMRAFVGRAHIPESVPKGVSLEDIR